ncbi:MAG: enoyl-CoA hydratase [Hyphomicrobiales bacterium]|nr:MAG: enoyl-CoA hydratase [Hyphomicrobiales bacterium]
MIRISIEQGIQTLQIFRPEKKNALTLSMYELLADALELANDDINIKSNLILGVPGAFSAGNDLTDFLNEASRPDFGDPIFRFLKALVNSRKPVVAGVDGLAIGIGTTMLFHCDYVVAGSECLFKTPFVDLGLVPEAASSLIAPALMGHARAFALLCLGENFNSQKMYDVGLVNQIVDADEVEERAMKIALQLASKPSGALLKSRELLRGDRSVILQRIDEEAAIFLERLQSPEAKSALSAFLKK